MTCPNHPERSKTLHPSLTCYRRHGCRCLECANYNRVAGKKYRHNNARRRGSRSTICTCDLHPSYTCYIYHWCRCQECKSLSSERNKSYRKSVSDKEIPNVIKDPAELERLRRMVGLI